ncbi:MAG: hypothetical protein P8Y79_11595 [Ignavibacteriaceae bacterium]
MANKILAVLEQREGILKKSAFEVVSAVRNLAEQLNLEPEAVVVGDNVSNIEEIAIYGLNKIVQFRNTDLADYSSSGYKEVVTGYAKETDADYIILSNTALGKDLAPRIAVGIDAGCMIDCINLDATTGELIATRPIYAGKALIDIKCNTAKKVITIRPNVIKAQPVENPNSPTIRNESS